MSSQSTACRRQTTWVRALPRLRWRLDHTFITWAWSSGRTSSHRRRTQCSDGHRAGVIGIVLVRVPGRKQPHPGGELRLYIENLFAGSNELLGEQVAESAGSLDREGPLRKAARPTRAVARAEWRRSEPALPRAPSPLHRSPLRYGTPCAGRYRSSLPPDRLPSPRLMRDRGGHV